ncbi:MAG: response regulator [Caldilineaceae bacterium]|nr:response regulator [Caldilineaceae bacterium]
MQSTLTPPAVILVVDDPASTSHLLLTALEQLSYRVIVVENGAIALTRLQYIQPDLVLLNVLMPELDGFTVCQRIKENPRTSNIPVIFMTALSDAIDRAHGFAVGGIDYITKPIEVAETTARIQSHLTALRLQRQLQTENEQLAERIQNRTADLQAEVARRRQYEQEKHKLLEFVRSQSEQLRELTGWLMSSQPPPTTELAKDLNSQLDQSLRLINFHLDQIDTVAATLSDHASHELIADQVQQIRTVGKQLTRSVQVVTTQSSYPATENHATADNPLVKLASREREVLQLVVEGKGNAEIADLLYLSETTVRTYRSRIMQKLALPDLPSLIKFAIRHNLTSLR